MYISLPPSLDQPLDDLAQIQADSAPPNPLQPVTLPVVPPALPTDEQQAFLIQELGRLNARIDDLLLEQPNLETVFQQQLAAVFPDLRRPINPNQIFYNRYREDDHGQKQLLSSEPLGSLLNLLRATGNNTYLTQESGAFYRASGTLDEGQRLYQASPTATIGSMLQVVFLVKLNEFWIYQGDAQLNTENQLVDLRRQVLAHQLALRTVDGTLLAAARTLADNVLKYPTAAARKKAFPAGLRPGVYSLMLENGTSFAAAFILSATDATPPAGSVMLFTPGEGFEAFKDLAHLNQTVEARLHKGESAGQLLAASLLSANQAERSDLPALSANPAMIDADVIAAGVRSLRIKQHTQVLALLRKDTLPVTGELDLAADLTSQVDVSVGLAARNLSLVVPSEPDWLKAASPTDQQEYKQLETALIDSYEALLPLLEEISTLGTFAEQETRKALNTLKPEYAQMELAPYKSLVRLRVSNSMALRVTGYRDSASGTVYISEDPKIDIPEFLPSLQLTPGSWNTQVVVDLRTLGSYAQRNVEPWSPHEIHRITTARANLIDTSGKKVGALNTADLTALAEHADVGAKYEDYLRSAFSQSGKGRTFATTWQRANLVRMRKDALESRLNPAVDDLFIFKTPGSGHDWIKAVIEHPKPATRPLVGGLAIDVNNLVMGSSRQQGQGGHLINGVLVIQRRSIRSRGVCVLYTPDAPDDAPFRELVKGLADLNTLKAKPEWRAYFTERIATNDAEELTRIFTHTSRADGYTATPITGDLQEYLYSAQLEFQIRHADYRSRSNAQIARESAVNAFLFAAEVADFLLDLVMGKALKRLLLRLITRGLRKARRLGQGIPGLIRKIDQRGKPYIAVSSTSIRPLTQGWVNVAEYRLPKQIDALFDVDDFAQRNQYTLSRRWGAASFTDNQNNLFIAMQGDDGRYHLHASYVADGAVFVKAAKRGKADFMVVPGDAKSWKPRFERTAVGGGPVLGVLRGRTAEQQVDDDLIAAFRRMTGVKGEETVPLMTPQQKRQLLDNALRRLNVDESTFRNLVWGQRGGTSDAQLRNALLTLHFEAEIYTEMNTSLAALRELISLSPLEQERLAIKIKRLAGKNDDFSKHVFYSIFVIDPDTDAIFVGYAFTRKQAKALEKFDEKFKISTWNQYTLEAFLKEGRRMQNLQETAAKYNMKTQQALDKFFEDPGLQKTYVDFKIKKKREQLTQLGIESFSESFKSSGIPYIALSRGKDNSPDLGVKAIDSLSVTDFEKSIPRYSTPLELTSTRVQTHRVERLPGSSETPSLPTPAPPSDPVVNIVRMDELAETQLPLLPDNARAKVDGIIQDIQAGRVSRKKIGNYTYTDLPQLDAGTGRGRWRMAFEKTAKEDGKDVFVFKGIIDYHGSKQKVWGL